MHAIGQILFLILGVGAICALKDGKKDSFGRRALRWSFGISFLLALPWLVLLAMALGFRIH